MINGFYSIYFTGMAGVGFGVVVLKDGQITGADNAGAVYDGKYEVFDENKSIVGNVILKSPPGAKLVTGASSGSKEGIWEIPLALPFDLGKGNPINLSTPTGPINIIFRKLRDF